MNIRFIQQKTPDEIAGTVAENVRRRRKAMRLSQFTLSKKSGVSPGSVKRFEATGAIALLSLIKIAIALECEDEITDLFSRKYYNSIMDIINEQD